MGKRSLRSVLSVRQETREAPTLDLLQRLSSYFSDLLEEYASQETVRTRIGRINWVVRDVDVAGVAVAVEGEPAGSGVPAELMSEVCASLVRDVREIVDKPLEWLVRQPRVSAGLLSAIGQLAALAGEFKGAITIDYDGLSTAVGEETAVKVDSLLDSRFSDWGSVEGYLDAVDIHGAARFRIYRPGEKRGIECDFPRDMLPKVADLLGKRVVAWGRLYRSRLGVIERVEVRDIHVLQTEPLDKVRPREPLWPSEDYDSLHRWTWS